MGTPAAGNSQDRLRHWKSRRTFRFDDRRQIATAHVNSFIRSVKACQGHFRLC